MSRKSILPESVRPTGHQDHFLSRLDRLAVPEVELALGLYRDHELMRFLLGELTLPEGAARVALSLDDPKAGPFVIVTREGRFVTCLGRGMKPGQCAIVTRAQVDALSARHGRLAAAVEASKRHGGLAGMMKRLYHAGDAVSREEIAAACEVQPLYAGTALSLMLEIAKLVLELQKPMLTLLRRPGPLGRHERTVLRQVWEAHWMLGHLAVISAQNAKALVEAAEGDWLIQAGTGLSAGFTQWSLFGAARAIWFVARVGKPLLPAYKHAYANVSGMPAFWEAHTALALMGLRHAKLRAEVLKELKWLPGCLVGVPEDAKELVTMSTTAAAMAFTRPEELHERALKRGREEALRRMEERAAREAGMGAAGRLSRELSREEDVPEEVARAMAVSLEGDFMQYPAMLLHLYTLLPWLARAKAEDVYLPRVWVEATARPWTPERTRVMLGGLLAMERWQAHKEREGKGPARKGECPCGSGKRYKRCCGG